MKKNNQKRTNRKLLTFFRMFRYGFDSFIRNSWLSVAATAVMTITLLIIFLAFVAQNVLNDTINDLSNKVDMSIYLKTETTDQDSEELILELKKLSSVRSVTYISAIQAREQIIEANKADNNVLDAIKEATNKNPATLRVVIKDINDTSQLKNFVDNSELLKDHKSTEYEPSFAGERRNTIQSIARAVSFAQKVGIAAGSIFIFISSLIIFNTIRMAIFNRREEIQMMKLIGADKSFIRGPFLVEAIIYGFIAALIATGIGIWALFSSITVLASYQIAIQPTIGLITQYGYLIGLVMILIGAIIGIISSLFATYRYLKL
ncbi:MAG: permease-like cell division protein FtsX [Candidatus Saccharibacteria bacterium]